MATFHKLISSAIMCNLKEKLPGTFSHVLFGVGILGGAENIAHEIRNLLSETIQTGHLSPWTLQMHSILSAELHSSGKYRTSFPSSFHGCGSVMDNSTHTCQSEVQTQFSLPVGSDKVTPWDPSSSSALQLSPSWKKPAHRCSPSLTWMTLSYRNT